jgi:hypothetical protein
LRAFSLVLLYNRKSKIRERVTGCEKADAGSAVRAEFAVLTQYSVVGAKQGICRYFEQGGFEGLSGCLIREDMNRAEIVCFVPGRKKQKVQNQRKRRYLFSAREV